MVIFSQNYKDIHLNFINDAIITSADFVKRIIPFHLGCVRIRKIFRQGMIENIVIAKIVLCKWLTVGYVENGITYPSRKGTPQGGIIRPTLSNMALDGLEEVVRRAVPRRIRVNYVRYADDFIITGKSKRLLERNVLPAVARQPIRICLSSPDTFGSAGIIRVANCCLPSPQATFA